jgi:hypothetical protein
MSELSYNNSQFNFHKKLSQRIYSASLNLYKERNINGNYKKGDLFDANKHFYFKTEKPKIEITRCIKPLLAIRRFKKWIYWDSKRIYPICNSCEYYFAR